MAPEQARAEKGLSVAADVYALGAVLYELLTGQPPFQADTPLNTILKVLDKEPQRPRLLQPDIDRDLETICLKCLEKKPSRRYESAAGLAEDLERWLRCEPISARPLAAPERFWRWCRRNRALSSAGGLAALAVATAFVISIGFGISRDRAAKQLREEQDRTREALEANQQLVRNLALQQGLGWCQQGDVSRGVLLLASTLENLPNGFPDLERYVRLNLSAWSRQLPTLRAVLQEDAAIQVVALSPDGRISLTGHADGKTRVWDNHTGKPVGPHFRQSHSVTAVALSNDQRLIVSASADGRAQLWDTTTGKPVGAALATPSPIVLAAFSPDGRLLATASEQSTEIRLWETATGKADGKPLDDPEYIVSYLGFTPDGRKLVTGLGFPRVLDAAIVKVNEWDLATRNQTASFYPGEADKGHDFGQFTTAMLVTPDGKGILTSKSLTVFRHQGMTGKLAGSPILLPAPTVAFSPDGQFALTAGLDHRIRLWDAATGKPVSPYLPHPAPLRQLSVDATARLILGCDTQGTARLWEVGGDVPIDGARPKEDPVGTAGLRNRRPQVFFPVEKGRPVIPDKDQNLPPKSSDLAWLPPDVDAVSWSEDGRFLLARSKDRYRLLDSSTGRTCSKPLPHPRELLTWAVSSDGEILLTVTSESTAQLWVSATGQPHGQQLRSLTRITTVYVGPDRRVAVTGGEDGIGQIWDVATGQPIGEPLRFFPQPFSPDGHLILTHDDVPIVQLRAAYSGRPIGPPWIIQRDVARHAAFSPDGRSVVVDSWVKGSQAWPVPPLLNVEVERFVCWLQARTGMELGPDGIPRFQSCADWRRARQRLEQIGGLPVP